MSAPDARWTEEAIRLYRRYEREVVHGLDLCPWAAPARSDGRVSEHVLLDSTDEHIDSSLAALDAVPAETDLALLLYPRLSTGREAFERFTARVRDRDVARRPPGDAAFVFVAFHPDAEANIEEAERLVPFLRRTPDPTIQVVRSAVLDRVRAAVPEGTHFVDVHALESLRPQPMSIRERISHANLKTTLRLGLGVVAEKLDDIIRDRQETYRSLASETTGAE